VEFLIFFGIGLFLYILYRVVSRDKEGEREKRKRAEKFDNDEEIVFEGENGLDWEQLKAYTLIKAKSETPQKVCKRLYGIVGDTGFFLTKDNSLSYGKFQHIGDDLEKVSLWVENIVEGYFSFKKGTKLTDREIYLQIGEKIDFSKKIYLEEFSDEERYGVTFLSNIRDILIECSEVE
jgi:hypothetical protein